jgi:hypothetical protein
LTMEALMARASAFTSCRKRRGGGHRQVQDMDGERTVGWLEHARRVKIGGAFMPCPFLRPMPLLALLTHVVRCPD